MNPTIHFTDYGVNTVTLSISADQEGVECVHNYTFSVFHNCLDERCDANTNFKIQSNEMGGMKCEKIQEQLI